MLLGYPIATGADADSNLSALSGTQTARTLCRICGLAGFPHRLRHSFPEFLPRFHIVLSLSALSVRGPTIVSELAQTPGRAHAPFQHMTFQSLPPT